MRMDICLSADDNYAKYMGTTIASILSNSKEDEEIYFHLLDGGITEENKEKLLSLKNIKNCDMKFYTPDFEKYKKWYELGNYNGRFSPAMFYRLDIHRLIPNVNKVLYLDCDTIVRSSLKELFDINIFNYYALVSKAIFESEDINLRKLFNFDYDDFYFNSGVLMINSNLWRKYNIEKEFENYFFNNTNCYGDQDILNYCLKGKVFDFGYKWNFIALKHLRYKFLPNLNNINILHYAVFNPLDKNNIGSLFLDEFWKYYQLTPWFLERPIDAIQTILAQKYGDYEETKLKINDVKCLGVYHNRNTLEIVIFFIKIRIEMSFKNVNKIAWFIPVKKWREAFRRAFDV
ncbi:glycosyltransferase family 8 protein [Brachyspira murdochii]|uniref:glycosyltransferase family 8 protein n=1 Tax=Brachyspira murdochii TaxID=84378 RepID=UPI003003BD73